MKTRSIIWISLLMISLTGTGQSLETVKQKYRESILELMDKNDVRGASVVAVSKDGVLWSESFGVKDEDGSEVDARTKFKIGSVTKVLTVLAILKEVDRGNLALDGKVSDYLPGFNPKLRDGTSADYTIRQVLTHKAGIPSDIFRGMYSDQSYLEVKEVLSQVPNASDPGFNRSYSNAGYSLLGAVIESVSGQSYMDYLQNNFFESVGIAESPSNESEPFNSKGDLATEGTIRDLPAGGLKFSAEDAAAFMIALLKNQWLSKSSCEEMYTPQLPLALDYGAAYGLPWNLTDYDELGRIAYHGGDTQYFHANMVMAVEKGLAILIMTNSSKGTRIGRLGARILNDMFKADSTIQTVGMKPVELPSVHQFELKEYNGEPEYANVIGMIKLKAPKRGNISGKLDKYKFKMIAQPDGKYMPKIMLFGFIPIKDKDTRWYFSTFEGYDVLIQESPGNLEVLGNAVESSQISSAWKSRVGKYEIVNPYPGEQVMITDLEMVEYSGRLHFTFAEKFGGSTLKLPLELLDRSTAFNLGWGRYSGNDFRFVTENGEEYLEFSGYRLRKKD